MTGTAYRTTAPPHSDTGPFEADAAVYAVYPPVITFAGVSSNVIVTTTAARSCTTVYPCDETGLLVLWHVIGSVIGSDHDRALHDAGYVRGVVSSDHT